MHFNMGRRFLFPQGVRQFFDSFAIVIGNFHFFWCLAAVGTGLLFWERDVRKQIPFVSGFTLFSFLAICPGSF